jgi:serine kinase of HPr protein (carbohydrate metabolism regulator)
MHEEALIHGTCLAIGADGVLLLGTPGSGKSGLALRLIDQPGAGLSGVVRSALLVADDQVRIRRAGESLIAAAKLSLNVDAESFTLR